MIIGMNSSKQGQKASVFFLSKGYFSFSVFIFLLRHFGISSLSLNRSVMELLVPANAITKVSEAEIEDAFMSLL